MKRFLQVALVCALVAFAQESLTNDSVVKMVKAGLSEPLIVSMIQKQPGKYSLTTDDLVNLKGQGVSDKVLAAMLAKDSGVSASATPTGSSVTSETDLPPDLEIGVYYKKGGKWEEMLPEVVNWKTGGVVKSLLRPVS